MWYLTSENDNRVIYVLEDKKITIGRSVDEQNCNFAVPDDPSLSRKHATLSLSGSDLILQDLGSKYGTYINNSTEKLETDVSHKLIAGNTVKFGKMNCMWKINHVSLVTCTSTLKGENLQVLRTNLGKLGAIFKSDWNDSCSYLTMPAITLTIKVVLALVQGSHIVTTDYWTKCIEAVNNNAALPSPKDYVPQILESTLNQEAVSFLPDARRKLLFADKKFIFFSRRQLEMYGTVLKKSSATPLLLSESKMTKSELCEPNVILIQYNITSVSQESQTQKDQINEIVNYLKCNKKRIIADAEIGLAILYCSSNKYCNPGFNLTSEVIKQVGPTTTKNNKILAQESQEPTQKLHEKENVVINESLNSKRDLNHDTVGGLKEKRKLDEDDDGHVHKKMVTENVLFSNESKKRVAEEELGHNSKKIALSGTDVEDNIFNFVTAKTTKNGNLDDTSKKLNLSKPSKRKFTNEDNDEDDLFNFVDSKKPCADKSNYSVRNDAIEEQMKKYDYKKVDDIDVEKLRGSKLQELMAANANKVITRNIKKEDISDLDEKFSSIAIGSTTIVVRNDLVVKRAPLEIKIADENMKNFKKFKKIWPVKMQISIIS